MLYFDFPGYLGNKQKYVQQSIHKNYLLIKFYVCFDKKTNQNKKLEQDERKFFVPCCYAG